MTWLKYYQKLDGTWAEYAKAPQPDAPQWFKVSSDANAKAWEQEVKARLIWTDESEAPRAFVEPHG